MGENKFSDFFVLIQSKSVKQNFCPAKILCYTVVRAVQTMASPSSVYDVLERLENDDHGLYSDDESDCEADGISEGPMTTSRSAEQRWMTIKRKVVWIAVDASSALTTGLVSGQYL